MNTCPACGNGFDTFTPSHYGGRKVPLVGDHSICVRCGLPLIITREGPAPVDLATLPEGDRRKFAVVYREIVLARERELDAAILRVLSLVSNTHARMVVAKHELLHIKIIGAALIGLIDPEARARFLKTGVSE